MTYQKKSVVSLSKGQSILMTLSLVCFFSGILFFPLGAKNINVVPEGPKGPNEIHCITVDSVLYAKGDDCKGPTGTCVVNDCPPVEGH